MTKNNLFLDNLIVIHRSNWNLEMLVFEPERGKPEYSEKNLSEQGRQQQTQPTYDAESGNQIPRATLVGGECSHHCAIRAPLMHCIIVLLCTCACKLAVDKLSHLKPRLYRFCLKFSIAIKNPFQSKIW